MRYQFLLSVLPFIAQQCFGLALFTEDFSYSDGELQETSAGTWTPTATDDGNPNLAVVDGELVWNFTGDPADPANDGFYGTSIGSFSSGSIYAHYDLTVVEAPSEGVSRSYHAAMWNGGNGYRSRVWIDIGDDNGTQVPDTFRMGISDKDAIVWDTTNYPEGTTLKLVVKNDRDTESSHLYINASSESDPSLDATTETGFTMKGFAFRHRDQSNESQNMGIYKVDNLAFSQAFGDISATPSEGPGDLVGTAVPGGISLSWNDRSFDETHFSVERRVGTDGSFTEIGTTGINVTNFVDTNTTIGTQYCYRVRAINGENLDPSNINCSSAFLDPSPLEEIQLVRINEKHYSFPVKAKAVYEVMETPDAKTWTSTSQFVATEDGERTIELSNEEGAAYFAQVSGSLYSIPDNIGLTEEFQMPNNATGKTLSITDFGATSDNSSDNDSTAFTAAFSAMDSGDILQIPAGTYHLKSTVTIPSGITINGAGQESATLLGSDVSTVFKINANSRDITLSSFAIDRDSGTMNYGIFVGDSGGIVVNRVWIHDIKIETFEQRGVQIRNAKHVKVEGCLIRNATNLGGGGFGYGITLNDSNNSNNWITNNTIGPVIRHGVLIQFSAHNNLVEHNTCFETTEDAYDLHGEDEYANELRFNTAYWPGAGSIEGTASGFGVGNTGSTHDKSGPANWIHHNEVYGYKIGAEVIQGSHSQYIDSNNFHDNADTGIKIHDGGGDSVYLRGNTLTDNGKGITVRSSDNFVAINNTVSGSEIGIRTEADSTGYTITNNDFSGNTTPSDIRSDDGTYSDNVE